MHNVNNREPGIQWKATDQTSESKIAKTTPTQKTPLSPQAESTNTTNGYDAVQLGRESNAENEIKIDPEVLKIAELIESLIDNAEFPDVPDQINEVESNTLESHQCTIIPAFKRAKSAPPFIKTANKSGLIASLEQSKGQYKSRSSKRNRRNSLSKTTASKNLKEHLGIQSNATSKIPKENTTQNATTLERSQTSSRTRRGSLTKSTGSRNLREKQKIKELHLLLGALDSDKKELRIIDGKLKVIELTGNQFKKNSTQSRDAFLKFIEEIKDCSQKGVTSIQINNKEISLNGLLNDLKNSPWGSVFCKKHKSLRIELQGAIKICQLCNSKTKLSKNDILKVRKHILKNRHKWKKAGANKILYGGTDHSLKHVDIQYVAETDQVYLLLHSVGSGALKTVRLAVNYDTGDLLASSTAKISGPGKDNPSLLIEGSDQFSAGERWAEPGTKGAEIAKIVRDVPNVLVGKHELLTINPQSGKPELFELMEFCDQGELKDSIKSKNLTSDQKKSITKDLLHALAGLHDAGVVHTDIDPGNILLKTTPDGTLQALLMDFDNAQTDRHRSFDRAFIADDVLKMGVVLYKMHFTDPSKTLDIVNSRKDGKIKEPPPNTIEHIIWEMIAPQDQRITSSVARSKFQKFEGLSDLELQIQSVSQNVNTKAKQVLNNLQSDNRESFTLTNLSGERHRIKIEKLLGKGAENTAYKINEVGVKERRVLLLSNVQYETSDRTDNITRPEQLEQRHFEEAFSQKTIIDELESRNLMIAPKIHGVTVLKHAREGITHGIIMEFLLDPNSLLEKPEQKHKFCLNIQSMMDEMHQAGICHGDLNLNNVKGRNNSQGNLEPVMIDWDKKSLLDIKKFSNMELPEAKKFIQEQIKLVKSPPGTPPYIQEGFQQKYIDLLDAMNNEGDETRFNSLRQEFIQLNLEKDRFGIAAAQFELLSGKTLPHKIVSHIPVVDREALSLELKSLEEAVPKNIINNIRNGIGFQTSDRETLPE